MTTYTVRFRTNGSSAFQDFGARTPEHALARAKSYDLSLLGFEPFRNQSVNEITVYDEDGNELIEWYDDELRLRLAARDLLEAAKKVVSCWERGDLAAAVHELDIAIAKATGGG